MATKIVDYKILRSTGDPDPVFVYDEGFAATGAAKQGESE